MINAKLSCDVQREQIAASLAAAAQCQPHVNDTCPTGAGEITTSRVWDNVRVIEPMRRLLRPQRASSVSASGSSIVAAMYRFMGRSR